MASFLDTAFGLGVEFVEAPTADAPGPVVGVGDAFAATIGVVVAVDVGWLTCPRRDPRVLVAAATSEAGGSKAQRIHNSLSAALEAVGGYSVSYSPVTCHPPHGMAPGGK